MFLIQIEHAVPNYAGWKQAFDSDPLGRRQSGVLRHRVMRPMDDDNYAIIELEFDTQAAAEAMLLRLVEMWKRVEGTVMMKPQVRIVEVVENADY